MDPLRSFGCRRLPVLLTGLAMGILPRGLSPAEEDAPPYELGPDSRRRDDVPRGDLRHGVWRSEDVYPDTVREYWVYVPARYDGTRPVNLLVWQDGHTYVAEDGDFRVPVVLDNLIHRGDLPVTIAVFVNPGHHGEDPPEDAWESSNRSFEYDTLSDRYARFLLDEFLPGVLGDLRVSDDPEDRAIGGISSGGICAFTVAWERPDAFRKVLSHVGSFTDIRGGHNYPPLVRKARPPKPLRVFLQAGRNDLDNRHGNWWLANRQMHAALEFAGYDVRFAGGHEGHNGKHGGAILPESLRWLWREHAGAEEGEEGGSRRP